MTDWRDSIIKELASQDRTESYFAVWFQGKNLTDLAVEMGRMKNVTVIYPPQNTPFPKGNLKAALPLVYKSERMTDVRSTLLTQNAKIARDAVEGANDDAELVDLTKHKSEVKAQKAEKSVGVKVVDGKPSKKSKTESVAANIPEDSGDDGSGFVSVLVDKKRKRSKGKILASDDEGDE